MDEFSDLECGDIREENKIEVWKRKFAELETQALMMKRQVELENVELEKSMEVYKTQYDGLCVKLEVKEMEFDDLILRDNVVDDELKSNKATIDGLIHRIVGLEEDKKVIWEFKKESDDGENCVHQLMTENMDLKCGKIRAEDEIEGLKKRVKELETKSALKMKHEVELKEKLEVFRTKCHGLFVKLEENKKGCDDDELKKYKKMRNGLKERISHLDDDRRVFSEREKRAQERISYVEKELKKKENEEREKYVELMTENRDLECGKRRAEDEIEVWKKRLGELETQVLRLKQVKLEKSVELEENKMMFVAIEGQLKDLLLRKIGVDDELKACKTTCNGLKERIMGLEEDHKVICEKEKRAQERIAYLEEEIKNIESDETEKDVELMIENIDLMCGKRRVDDEIEIWKKKFRDLETRAMRMKQVELEKAELEKELEILLTKYDEFSMEFEEKKMEHKRMCNGLKERIISLEEDQKVIGKKEKRAQERITYLEEKIRKMENDEREKHGQLKTENRHLECWKKRAENEIEIWKKRFRELEAKVLRLEEENSTLRCIDSQISGKMELEPGGLQSKVSYNDKGKKYNRSLKFQNETDGGTDGAHVANLKIKEKILLNDNEKILTSSFAGCNHPSSVQENIGVHITGPASVNMQSEPLVNVKEEKKDTLFESKVEFGSRVRQKLVFELEGSSTKKLALREHGCVRLASGGIVDISEREVKKEITPKHTCDIGGKEMFYDSTDNTSKRSSDYEKDLASKKRLKRPCSDLRGEEYWSSCEDDIPLSSALKRRSASKTVNLESESEDDDRIPIGKLKMKKLELNKGVHKLFPLNHFAGNVTPSSGGQHVEESISPSTQRSISLRQCEEKKNWGERTSRNESPAPDHLLMSGISYQKAGNSTSENGKENVVEDVGSHSEGKRLGGIILTWSDSSDSGDSSSDSEDAGDTDFAFNQVIAMIKWSRVKESKWKFEADMLSSFEEDSELCMKAVCALYRQQISDGKLMKGSLHSNNGGFNKHDALRGTSLAAFLMDGDQEGDLKKSVKELEKFDPKALEECKRLATHYSKQLFAKYQNKEDPFFLPSGV